jgi:hypothetical protein
MLYPSFFVSFDIVPFDFEFIAESPQELTLDSMVKDVSSAIAKSLDVSIAEVVGVDSAFAVPDH